MFRNFDVFKKIPSDLTDATVIGASLSVAAGVFMSLLFCVELYAFLRTTIETGILLDTNGEEHIRINFNVTMLDLACEFAAVDIVDVLGTNTMSVTKNVDKWSIDERGQRTTFHGRNTAQKALVHDDHHTAVEELEEYDDLMVYDLDAARRPAFLVPTRGSFFFSDDSESDSRLIRPVKFKSRRVRGTASTTRRSTPS